MNKILFFISALSLFFYACNMGGSGRSNNYNSSSLKADGVSCTENSECASGLCKEDICKAKNSNGLSFGESCTGDIDCASSTCNSTFDKCGCENDSNCTNSGVCVSNGLCVNIDPIQNICTKGFLSYRFKILAGIGTDTQDITSSCTFTSDTLSLATPNQDASFNCLAVGQTNIKASLPSTYDSKKITASITIYNTFNVSPEPATCIAGSTVDIVAKYGPSVVTDSTNWTVIGGSGQITASATKGKFNCNTVGLGQYEAKYSTYATNYGNIYVTPVGGCTNPRLYPSTKSGAINSYVCFDPYCGDNSQVSTISAWGPTGNPVAQPLMYNNRGGCFKCKTAGTMTVSVHYAGSQISNGTLTCN
ncbi:MAG: hypothetical protein NTY22_05890 [Proteobacteria bacterium]|nr:hypothetical protein [Pseudomonadota bacterium]